MAADGQGVKGSGRGLHGVGVDADAVFGRDDDGIHPGTFAGTGYGAEVAHVGYAVEQDEQRGFPFLEKGGHDVFHPLIAHGGHEGHHARMVFARDAVELFRRDALNGDEASFQCGEQLFGQFALHVALYQYLVNVFSGFQSLNHGPYAEYHFASFLYHSVSVCKCSCVLLFLFSLPPPDVGHCFSRALALLMAASVSVAPLSMWAISSTRSSGVSWRMWLVVPCSSSSLYTL